MGDWYLGEIRLFAGSRIPTGWQACNGQLLPLNQNQALFSLLGNRYGGDGRTTFALPDLRGRVPSGYGNGPNGVVPIATAGGAETVTLTLSNLPLHAHGTNCMNANAAGATPANSLPATSTKPPSASATAPAAPNLFTAAGGATQALVANSVQTSGGGQPHENRQPFLAMTYCIAVSNCIYPPRQ